MHRLALRVRPHAGVCDPAGCDDLATNPQCVGRSDAPLTDRLLAISELSCKQVEAFLPAACTLICKIDLPNLEAGQMPPVLPGLIMVRVA